MDPGTKLGPYEISEQLGAGDHSRTSSSVKPR